MQEHKTIKEMISDIYEDVDKTASLGKYRGIGLKDLANHSFLPHGEHHIIVDDSRSGFYITVNGPTITVSEDLKESGMFDFFESVGNGIDFDVKKYYDPEVFPTFVYKKIDTRFILNIKENPEEPVHITFTTSCEEFALSAIVVNVLDGVDATIIEELNSYGALVNCVDYTIAKNASLELATMNSSIISSILTNYRYVYVGKGSTFKQVILASGTQMCLDETRVFPSEDSNVKIAGAISTITHPYAHLLEVHSSFAKFEFESLIYNLDSDNTMIHRHDVVGRLPDSAAIMFTGSDIADKSHDEIERSVTSFLRFISKNITLSNVLSGHEFYTLRERITRGI